MDLEGGRHFIDRIIKKSPTQILKRVIFNYYFAEQLQR